MIEGLPARTLGRYRLVERIGAGGMGVVWRAEDERLLRDVAIKVLPEGALDDRTARDRFRQEALALAKLNHPNIATIFDFDDHDGIYFLVMEYIVGDSLDALVARGPLDESEVRRAGEQLAVGVDAAHARGVLHRDLKPGNLRMTPRGLLKILDFGLATLIDIAQSAPTVDIPRSKHATGFAGTPGYMAPEQVCGGPLDVRTDIYGVGAVLYELACGRRPFDDVAIHDLPRAISTTLPPRPRDVARVSPRLDAIITKALATQPADRYRTARELADDLRVLTDRGVSRRKSTSIDSIAVLPFRNETGDDTLEYLADGITDRLIHALSALPSLKKVIARNSVYKYRNVDVTAEQIGRDFDVRAALLGELRRHGDSLSARVELVDTGASRHVWGRAYDCDLGTIKGLDQVIADDAARSLGIVLRPRKASSGRGSAGSAAYHLYLKGRFFWNKRPMQGAVERAIELFQQAIDIDPTFALAHAGLADCYNTLGSWEASGLPPHIAFRQAQIAARTALHLDQQLAEAHTAQAYTAMHYDWRWRDAELGFRHALELNANYPPCRHWRAHMLVAAGRFDEALAESRRIIELDPFDLIINAHLAWHHQMAHEFSQAYDAAAKTLDLDGNFHWGHFFAGWALEQLGELDRAIDSLRRAVDLSGGSTVMRTSLTCAYGRAGDLAAVQRDLADFQRLSATQYVSSYEIGVIHVAAGEIEAAWNMLEHAFTERSGWMPYIRCEPRLADLHSDPRFNELLTRLNLPNI